jgi:hypothetical protein
MNIESLADYISEFRIRVIDSGFKRDVQDFLQSLPNNQGNIIALREMAEKLCEGLAKIYTSDLPEALNRLFPTAKPRPFTEKNRLDEVAALASNKTIPQAEFFQKLNEIVQQIQAELQQNEAEIKKIELFISSYVEKDVKALSDAGYALVSIVFKDAPTISSLKELTKTLTAWNRILPLYHRLLKNESPEDVRLVQVQNGSIDFIVNLDVDVAINLADVFATGFKCYAAYLAYKKILKPITDTYYGNKKLIAGEEERDKEMLNNIGVAIAGRIEQQHEIAKASGVKSVHSEKMIEQIANLVTSHIVRGNDIKLISLPKADEKTEVETRANQKKIDLREASIEAKNARRALPPDDMRKLLEMYGEIKGDPKL